MSSVSAALPCGRIGRLVFLILQGFCRSGRVCGSCGKRRVVDGGDVFHGFHRPWSRARRGLDLRSSCYPWRFSQSTSDSSVRISHPSGSRSPKRSHARSRAPETRSVRGRVQSEDHRSVAHCSSVQVQPLVGSRRRREPETKIRIPARVQSGLTGCTQPQSVALVPGPTRYRNNRSGLNDTPSRTT